MVAVEADQRQQLPDHLQHLGHDDQQQRVEAGGPPDAHDGDGDDRVEVQPAEVGPDAAGAAQPVGIGDVGEERGPDQVEAGAHGPGGGAAAAGGRGMPELVEPGGQHGHGQDQQHQARVGERLVGGRGQALDHEHPPAGGEEGRGHQDHDQRVEERREGGRDPAGALRVGDGVAELHPEQRVGLADLGLGAVGQLQQAQGQQLGVDQRPDVVGADQPAEPGAGVAGDFLGTPGAVDRLEDQIQQPGELQRLAVGAADQGRCLAVAGALGLAEELDAVGPDRNRQGAGGGDAEHSRRS